MTNYPNILLDQAIQFISYTHASEGQAVQAVGQMLAPGEIVKIPIPGDFNAYYCTILPRPALPCYENIPAVTRLPRDGSTVHSTSPQDLATAGMFIITLFALPNYS